MARARPRRMPPGAASRGRAAVRAAPDSGTGTSSGRAGTGGPRNGPGWPSASHVEDRHRRSATAPAPAGWRTRRPPAPPAGRPGSAAAARARSPGPLPASRSGARRSHRNAASARDTAAAWCRDLATAVSVAGRSARASASITRTWLPARCRDRSSAAPARAVARRSLPSPAMTGVPVRLLDAGDQARRRLGQRVGVRADPGGQLGQPGRGQIRVDVDPEQRLGPRGGGPPVTRRGQRFGPQFHVRAGSPPGRGAAMELPCWYQARCRSAAQARMTRSATSSRRPSGGRIASIQPRICPAVTGVLGLQAGPGRGPLELRPPGAEPVIAEQEMRLARGADPQRVGDPADRR